ncbi:MAG: glycosyltransferase [Alphaproteobacteria bacterium]|nr:glycosyltransferase [Alphaproteobacteria bacterium]
MIYGAIFLKHNRLSEQKQHDGINAFAQKNNKKIKVAFCIPNMVIGGVETVFTTTVDMLLKSRVFDICVFTHAELTEPYYVQWFKDRPQIKVVSVYRLNSFFEKYKKKFGFPLENIRKIIFSIYKKWCNYKIARNPILNTCDIIIDYVSGSSFRQIQFAKQPKITWLHCSINYAIENKIPARLKQYNKIVCISDSMKSDFAKLCPEYADRLVRIYNPVDYDSINKTSLNTPKYDGKYFLCVGRVDHDKDIPTIIRAFNQFWLREHKPDVKMVFIGDGNIASEMKKMAATTEAHDQFVFLGKIPKPYGYMRGAMAHILSSFNEGLPTVLIEAMATGTLNISSNCPNGPHEILLDGDAGILFEPGNTDELANAMSNVWNNKIDVSGMTGRATKSLERFNQDSICTQIIKVISDAKK